MKLALLWISLQGLEPATFLPEVGQEVVVLAKSAQGAPLRGLAVRVTRSGQDPMAVGSTDEHGRLAFKPEHEGSCELRANVPGARPEDPQIELVAVLQVQPTRRRQRLLYWTVPLGLLLCWHGLRRWRQIR